MVPLNQPFEAFFDLVPTGAALYAPIFDASGELVDFRCVRLNPAGQRLLGLPAQPPHTFREHYPNSVPTGIFAQYRTAFLTGQASTYDVPYQGDGFDTFFRLAAQRSGELLMVNFLDMADLPRSAVEQALRNDRAREQAGRAADAEQQRQHLEQQRTTFYQVFELTPAAICIQRGPAHRFEYANAAYLHFFPGRDVLGKSVAEAIPETVDSGVLALLDRVYETGETYYGYELPLLIAQPAGPPQQMYFTFTYQALRENGEIVGISTFAYNVAEQVLARQARDAQQRVLETVFDRAPVALSVLQGPTHVLRVVNPAMSELLGQPASELLGQPFAKAFPGMAAQGYPELLAQVWRTGLPMTKQESPARLARHQAGELGYFNFVYQPIFDGAGQVSDIMCVAVDVTEQVRARQQVQTLNEELTATNEQLHESNAQLLRTNTDLDTFVYTASHDLKAPITNIEGILAALRDTLPAAVQHEAIVAQLLGLLDATVNRFQTTITQLTDLTRLQRTYSEPAELLALAPVVAGVLADLTPQIAAAAAQVHVAVPAELSVSFAPASLRSIVYNLLSNAAKYHDPARPAQVWLRAEQQPAAVVLTVQDNGLGLTASQQQRLFGVFQRLHTHVEGTGVGLYMIKRLIENAGATIAVTSAPGVGTTFTVTFPA
ncbi:MAG: PAS domain-containing protein [Janthinobacterium lividum]